MAGPAPELAVVVPHRRRVDLLGRALGACAGWPTIVVDDSDAGLDPAFFPEALRVRLGGGSGFARAANAGLEEAFARGFKRVILLNDDAEPQPGCLAALAASPATLAGPLLLRPDGSVESAGIEVSPRWNRVRTRSAPGAEPPTALSGACLAMPTELRFDEGFPHGMEDVELALRVRAAGGSVRLHPEARCLHHGGATVDRRSVQAAEGALLGHLRLARTPGQRAAALGLALAQALREGPPERLPALLRAWIRARS